MDQPLRRGMPTPTTHTIRIRQEGGGRLVGWQLVTHAVRAHAKSVPREEDLALREGIDRRRRKVCGKKKTRGLLRPTPLEDGQRGWIEVCVGWGND